MERRGRSPHARSRARVVGIGTVRNLDVPVSVEVLGIAPGENCERWDHVVECTLEVGGMRLVIAGCTDHFPGAARIAVSSGTYRLCAHYANLKSLSDGGLDGDDRYHLQLWPAPAIELRVLKRCAN